MGNTTSEVNALLGRGSEFEGKLMFEGTVRIDGKFAGEVFSDDTLIVGEGARVKAEITVAHVIIYGDVVGNINASDSIELHAPARLKGNIIAPSLVVEQGVIFDGNCQMASNPEQRERMERELAEEAAVEAAAKRQPQLPPPETTVEPAVV
jgi:cytoskeletal protein CcmA (bactofilin family)